MSEQTGAPYDSYTAQWARQDIAARRRNPGTEHREQAVSEVQHKMIHDVGDDYRCPYELRVRPSATDPRVAIVSIESGVDRAVIVLEDQQRRDLIVALGGTP